ncbi:hypothetical protein CWI42_140030 [Ordospora colligata]|nr:hypothetical protein CWI42_140030 [Ordospora colligata]
MSVMIVNDIEEHDKTEKTEEEEDAESMDKLKAIIWPTEMIGMLFMTFTINDTALHSYIWMIPTIVALGLALGFDSSTVYSKGKKGWKQWIALLLSAITFVVYLIVFIITASTGFKYYGYAAYLIRWLVLGSLLRWLHTVDMLYGIWKWILDFFEGLCEGRETIQKCVKHVWWLEHVMVGIAVFGCVAANLLALYAIRSVCVSFHLN